MGTPQKFSGPSETARERHKNSPGEPQESRKSSQRSATRESARRPQGAGARRAPRGPPRVSLSAHLKVTPAQAFSGPPWGALGPLLGLSGPSKTVREAPPSTRPYHALARDYRPPASASGANCSSPWAFLSGCESTTVADRKFASGSRRNGCGSPPRRSKSATPFFKIRRIAQEVRPCWPIGVRCRMPCSTPGGACSDPCDFIGSAPSPRIEPTEFRSCLLAPEVFRGASHKLLTRCDSIGLRVCAGPPRDPLNLRTKGHSCLGSLLHIADTPPSTTAPTTTPTPAPTPA